MAGARSLARRRWAAARARSARPEPRLAAGLRARPRALPRAGTGSSAVAADAAPGRRGDDALAGAIARGVPRRPGRGPPAGACLLRRPRSSSRRCPSLQSALPPGCWSGGEDRLRAGELNSVPSPGRGSRVLVVGLARRPSWSARGGAPTSSSRRTGSRAAATTCGASPAVEFARQPIQGVGARQLRGRLRPRAAPVARSRSIRTASS